MSNLIDKLEADFNAASAKLEKVAHLAKVGYSNAPEVLADLAVYRAVFDEYWIARNAYVYELAKVISQK